MDERLVPILTARAAIENGLGTNHSSIRFLANCSWPSLQLTSRRAWAGEAEGDQSRCLAGFCCPGLVPYDARPTNKQS